MMPGQMLHGQMSSWQLESAQDGRRNLHLKFDQNWASNSWDMALFLLVNYRDPKKKSIFAKPVVDIAASSRNWIWLGGLASWGWGAV